MRKRRRMSRMIREDKEQWQKGEEEKQNDKEEERKVEAEEKGEEEKIQSRDK
jgi:hypothetical protein